jgi:hypothetical protein
MAEPATKKVHSEEAGKKSGQWKEVLAQVGMLALTGFLTGLSMAAGNHLYVASANKLGTKPGGNVIPLRKVM